MILVNKELNIIYIINFNQNLRKQILVFFVLTERRKMKKKRLKRWVKVVLTIFVIHISFFIWKQTGLLGELAKNNNVYLLLCLLSWFYLIFGQVLIYEKIWK